MPILTYRFVTGEKSEVEVTEEFYVAYQSLEKADLNSDRKETRRHVSFEELIESGIGFAQMQNRVNLFLDSIENDALRKVMLSCLSPRQIALLEKFYFEGYHIKEIAEMEGVPPDVISSRKKRILSVLKKNKNFFQ